MVTKTYLFNASNCFVQDIKVAFEISTSIWQKKILNRFEQFWVEIYFKKLILNPGQITWPSINLKVVLKRKLAKNFKKVGSICGNLSYKSQLLKVWAVFSFGLSFLSRIQLKTSQTYWHFFSVKLMWKSQKQLLYLVQSSVRVCCLLMLCWTNLWAI